MKRLYLLLIWLVGLGSSPAIELTLSEEMTLPDFYSQGIYPSISMKDGIAFTAAPLTISVGKEENLLQVERALASFTFTVDAELMYGMVNVDGYTSVEEAVTLLEGIADRLGVEPRYGTFPPIKEPGASTLRWTSMSVKYTIPNSVWSVAFLVRRSEEMAFLHVGFDRPTTRKEDYDFSKDWDFAPMLQAPEEWSHLPLKGEWRGRDPEVTKFTYLVSSYDDEGKLLPELAKLREEIERKADLEADQRFQKPPPRQRGGSGTAEPKPVTAPQPEENPQTPWILAALGLLLIAAGYYYLSRRGQRQLSS